MTKILAIDLGTTYFKFVLVDRNGQLCDTCRLAPPIPCREKEGRVCEADFHAGKRALTKGKKNEALQLFRLAAGHRPHDFREGRLAEYEVGRLAPKL